MEENSGILRDAFLHAVAGGTALVVAPDFEHMKTLMRSFMELGRVEGAAPAALDDRTVRVGSGFCAFFTSETIDFVLERKYWYAARTSPGPKILWVDDARERAAEQASMVTDKSIDRSYLLFGKAQPEYDER